MTRTRRSAACCLLLLPLLGLVGCTWELQALTVALAARQASHCLRISGATSYGTATLYTRTGDLDCEGLWRADRREAGP
jgi:hypothetical protein